MPFILQLFQGTCTTTTKLLSHLARSGNTPVSFPPDSLLPPREVKQLYVPTTILPIPHLRIYDDAYCCKLCPPDQPYVIRSEKILLGHLKEAHQWNRSKGFADRPSKSRLPLSTASYFVAIIVSDWLEWNAMILFTGGRGLHYMLRTRPLTRGAENSTFQIFSFIRT